MIVYPAIDLRRGQVVRLSQGDFDREQAYDTDPVSRAAAFVEAGAQWLHVVDLDAAKGEGDNRAVIESIAALGTSTQVGGGVRDPSLLERGVDRLVVGSLLLRDRAMAARLVEEADGRIAFGLDHRNGRLSVSGWQEDGGFDLEEVLDWDEVRRSAAVIVTDIATDGMLTGPNLKSMVRTVELSPVPVVCSGGVGTLDDVRATRDTGVAGVIIGRALYEGRFTLEEALAAAA